MRFYKAICNLLEASADLASARAEYVRTPEQSEEPQPLGADAMVERSDHAEPFELRTGIGRTQDEQFDEEDRQRGVGFGKTL